MTNDDTQMAALNTAVIPAAIPPHIAGNLLEFLRRTPSTGLEAIGWVEAYHYVQQFAPSPSPGVPFTGLPQQSPK